MSRDAAQNVAPTGERRTSGAAVASLVLGILGLVVPVVCAIAAIVLGLLGLGETRRDPRVRGVGPATAGLTLGVLGLAWWIYLLILLAGADWA
jgi:hypothetical protein